VSLRTSSGELLGLVEHTESDGSDQRSVRNQVLHAVWRTERLSRADIARKLVLSRSTVSGAVQELIDLGFLAEVGRGKSRGGRRPIMLDFQYGARCVLGVDVGATQVSVALTDLQGRVLQWREVCHPVRTDPMGTRRLILRLCDDSLCDEPGGHDRLIGIGIAVPSPVDPALPEWLSQVVIPDWQGRSDLGRLHKRYGVPIFIDNDATLGALAEQYWGAGRDVEDFVFVKLGRGIGAGYVLGGEVYRGSRGIAGEIGHLSIDPLGPACVCGQRGCLVKFVGSTALKERIRELWSQYPDSILANQSPTLLSITQAALDQDPLACRVVREASQSLSTALAGYVHLFNPRMIIIGGRLAQAGEILLSPIQKIIARASLLRSVPSVECRTSQLGDRVVAIGAATLGMLRGLMNGYITKQKA